MSRSPLPTLFASVTFALAAAGAQAAPIATVFDTFSAAEAALGTATKIAVAQGRIGNAATTGDYQVGLHIGPNFTNAGPLGTRAERQFAWADNVFQSFTLSRSGNSLRFVLGNYDETWTNPGVAQIDAMILRAAATSNSTTRLRNLSLDDAAPGTLAPAAINETNGDMGLLIGNITGNFTFTGEVAFDWTQGRRPNGSAMAFQIKAFDTPNLPGGGPAAIPAPAGLAALGLAAVRRRA